MTAHAREGRGGDCDGCARVEDGDIVVLVDGPAAGVAVLLPVVGASADGAAVVVDLAACAPLCVGASLCSCAGASVCVGAGAGASLRAGLTVLLPTAVTAVVAASADAVVVVCV